jgi:phosphoribosylformylglycinamidine synthase
MELKEAGNALYLLGVTRHEIGGSEYLRLHDELGGSVPKVDAETNFRAYRKLLDAMDSGFVRACHDSSEGGLAVAIAEMAFTGDLGVDVDLAKVPVVVDLRDDILLFSESNGRMLIEVQADKTDEFEKLMNGTAISCIGAIKTQKKLTVSKDGKPVFEESLDELMAAWKTPLEAQR